VARSVSVPPGAESDTGCRTWPASAADERTPRSAPLESPGPMENSARRTHRSTQPPTLSGTVGNK